MVALCRRRSGFLALPCSLGFRLAASPTGRTRLRPFAKGAFWGVRSPAAFECEKTLEFTAPKSLLKGGGSAQALTGDCRIPAAAGAASLGFHRKPRPGDGPNFLPLGLLVAKG